MLYSDRFKLRIKADSATVYATERLAQYTRIAWEGLSSARRPSAKVIEDPSGEGYIVEARGLLKGRMRQGYVQERAPQGEILRFVET